MDKSMLEIVRRNNLNTLIAEFGGTTKFAQIIKRSQSQVSRWKKNKAMGEEICRHIEDAVGRPMYWMDRAHGIDENIMSIVMEGIDEALEEAGLTIDRSKYRKLIALCYRLIAENGVDMSTIKSLTELVK